MPADVAADPERRTRFERVARAVAVLSHPHICVVHDVGQDGGVDWSDGTRPGTARSPTSPRTASDEGRW